MPELAAETLQRALRGDFRGWRGLPAGLLVFDLLSTFPRDSDWSGAAQLGHSHRETEYFWVKTTAWDTQLRLWRRGDHVVLLDQECSIPADIEQLTSELGEVPEAFDTWYGTLPMAGSELVFPDHGLAGFVNRETHSLWHVAFFVPTAIETYLSDLQINMETRRHPRRLW